MAAENPRTTTCIDSCATFTTLPSGRNRDKHNDMKIYRKETQVLTFT